MKIKAIALKRKSNAFWIALLILLVLTGIFYACAVPDGEPGTEQTSSESAGSGADLGGGVTRVNDRSNGNVCYVTDKGGIFCMPE